jgi:hypothetical protein
VPAQIREELIVFMHFVGSLSVISLDYIMFKIKRTSNRTLNNKDVLVEVVENTGERPPLPDRPLRRPPSAKVPPRHRATPNSEDTLSNASK